MGRPFKIPSDIFPPLHSVGFFSWSKYVLQWCYDDHWPRLVCMHNGSDGAYSWFCIQRHLIEMLICWNLAAAYKSNVSSLWENELDFCTKFVILFPYFDVLVKHFFSLQLILALVNTTSLKWSYAENLPAAYQQSYLFVYGYWIVYRNPELFEFWHLQQTYICKLYVHYSNNLQNTLFKFQEHILSNGCLHVYQGSTEGQFLKLGQTY